MDNAIGWLSERGQSFTASTDPAGTSWLIVGYPSPRVAIRAKGRTLISALSSFAKCVRTYERERLTIAGGGGVKVEDAAQQE